MDQYVLGQMIKNICRYYGKSEPKAETLSEWMKDLSNIPNEPITWIESKIKANRYPDNPPQAIRKLFYQWLEEHPDRIEREQAGCPECTHGWLWASKNGESRAFRCRLCNNQGNQPGIAVIRPDLTSHGWSLHWSHGTLIQIKSMVEHANGKRVMPKGITAWADNKFKPVTDQDWRDQF
jgi:hypothetical protein